MVIPHNFSFSLLPFFPGNVSYNCHFCQSVEEIPALNSNDAKKHVLEHWF